MSKKNPFLNLSKYPVGTVLGRVKCAAKITCGKDANIVVHAGGLAWVKCPHCNDDLASCSTNTFYGKTETAALAARYDAARAAPPKLKTKEAVEDDGPKKIGRTGDNSEESDNFGILV